MSPHAPRARGRALPPALLALLLISAVMAGPASANVGLTAATLTSPVSGTTLTYGQHFTYCYVIPTTAPDNSNDPYSGKPSTASAVYVDGKVISSNEPDVTPRGVEQCPLDTYATSPGTHTWWIVLSILEWRVTSTSPECLPTPPVPSECFSWATTGETSTSAKGTYTVAAAPSGPVGVSINSGATYTTTPAVTLHVSWPAGATGIIVANDGGFANAKTFALVENVAWNLVSSGDERLPKTVYVRFKDKGDTTYTDDIILDETPPLVTAPTLSVAAARDLRFADAGAWTALLAASTHTVVLSWSGSDSNSGIDRFELQSSDASGSWAAVALSNANATSASTTLSDGTYRFRVRAKDKAGNWSGWATSGQLQISAAAASAAPSGTPLGTPDASASATDALPGDTSGTPIPTSGAEESTVPAPTAGEAPGQVSAIEVVGLAFGSGVAGAALLLGGFALYRRMSRRS